MSISVLPTINATLNFIAAFFLTFGFVQIKQKRINRHKKLMLSALITSAFFLTSYLIYHANAGSTPYPYFNWTRSVYFAVLIPHIILAALMSPFIVVMVWRALRGQYEKHKRLAKWVWPVWMYVSVSGVTVYLMLYHL